MRAIDAVKGKHEAWIRITSELKGREVIRITVEDSGVGIMPSIAGSLMQPFFTTKETGKGTGLGLSISKALIEEHGGTLFLNSEAAHTCFVIEIPSPKLARAFISPRKAA